MCQKVWKLAGSRQSYCKNYQAYFFLAHPVHVNRTRNNLHLDCMLYAITTTTSPQQCTKIPSTHSYLASRDQPILSEAGSGCTDWHTIALFLAKLLFSRLVGSLTVCPIYMATEVSHSWFKAAAAGVRIPFFLIREVPRCLEANQSVTKQPQADFYTIEINPLTPRDAVGLGWIE